MCSYRHKFFQNIFNSWLVRYEYAEPNDQEENYLLSLLPFFFFFCSGSGLHLEPLHQLPPLFFMMGFSEIGSHKVFPQSGFKS
jgi:hypothetical protein